MELVRLFFVAITGSKSDPVLTPGKPGHSPFCETYHKKENTMQLSKTSLVNCTIFVAGLIIMSVLVLLGIFLHHPLPIGRVFNTLIIWVLLEVISQIFTVIAIVLTKHD